MRVVKLETMFKASDWRRQFADHLIQLRPEMNPDAADEASDTEYRHSNRLSPAEAARRFADVDSEVRDDGAPADIPPHASGSGHG